MWNSDLTRGDVGSWCGSHAMHSSSSLFCAFLSALIIKVADRHDLAILKCRQKSESMQSAIGDFSIGQPFHFLTGWKNLLLTFIALLFSLCAGLLWHISRPCGVLKLTKTHKRKQTNKISTLYLNPFIPPSPTHTHGRIPTGNKCQSSFLPSHLSLTPSWMECVSFFHWWTVFSSTYSSLLPLEFQKAH